ncbi:MAG: metal ABC transporter permease [Anaerolineae bacterium]|nr:metal ABC transporter permease [Anaerolineae bacterium]
MDTLVNFLVEPPVTPLRATRAAGRRPHRNVAAVIGAFVVLRACPSLGDAMAHAVLPASPSPSWWGKTSFSARSAAHGDGGRHRFIKRSSRLREDSAIGIMLVGAFAL